MKTNLFKALVSAVIFSMLGIVAFAQCDVTIGPGEIFLEDFESGNLDCWTIESNGGAIWDIVVGNTSAVTFHNASSGDQARLISPTFDLSSVNSATLSFTYAMVALTTYDILEVSYRTSESDSWHILDSYSFSDWNNFYEASFDLPDISATYQISFMAISQGGYYIIVDNVEIAGEGGCSRPVSLTATEITDKTALLGWSTNGNEESWIIELNGEESIVTEQPYLAEGLTPLTYYTFRVRANCGNDMQSDWATAITFRTNSTMIMVTDDEPFFDDFEASDEFLYWENEIISGDGGWVVDPGYVIPNNTAFFIWLNEEARLNSVVMDISTVTNPTLVFKHKQPYKEGGCDEMNVWYRVDENDTWHFLASYTEAADQWLTETLSLPNPSATYQVSFKALSNYKDGVYVDDVWIGSSNDAINEDVAITTSISPNPTNGMIVVNANVDNASVVVCDLSGRQIAEGVISAGRAEFDLSGCPDGVYFVKISDENTVKTVKVVKE